MYSHHFGLTQDPFSIAPDPRYLFMSERHREALAHLLYGVAGADGSAGGAGGGFVLLTGEIGTGKTTICRCFLEQIPPGCHVAYIFNPKLSVTELLQSICEEFHVATTPAVAHVLSAKNYIDALNAFLLQSHAAGQSCVLIIDEAQNLEPDVLEQLRLLTNLETNERKLLQIVLIGQPELRAMLARPALEQLAQRVIARFHLDALNLSEATHYIQHRLAVAGHTGPLPFDAKALRRIHTIARGVPRRINLLCGRSMLGAWANGLQHVDQAVVNKAAGEVFGADVARTPRWNATRTTYLLISLVLVAGAALAGLMGWQDTTPSTSPASAHAPSGTAGAALPVVVQMIHPLAMPAPRVLEDAPSLMAQLPGDMTAAWRQLSGIWKLPATDGNPCQVTILQPLQCYQAHGLTLPQLRQLGRPGVLTLQPDHAPPVHAVLVGLTEQTATLQIGITLHTVRLVSLGRLWQGDFATYWQAPPGYTPDMQDGSTGPAIDTLARQLAKIEGVAAPGPAAAPALLDNVLRDRVRAFQRAQGLKPDGQPGPLTFMQIESAAGMTEPHLQTVLR